MTWTCALPCGRIAANKGEADMRQVALILVAFAAAGCSITVPVAIVGKEMQNDVMRGTATATPSGGTFSARNSKTSCSGSYDAWDTSATITMPVVCSDGRKGVVIATRNRNGISGGGTYTLSDGSTGTFIFGEAANQI